MSVPAAEVRPPLPRFLQIEPVGQCNLRCQMCPILYREDGPPYGPPAFMAFEIFTALLEQFVGVEELQLQGLGEPMMHPRFFDMVAHAAARGITVSTNSNMTLLPPARAERCVRSGLERLHVSIDSARAETFERIRKRARLDRVLGNVRGGLSGPAIRPIALLKVKQVYEIAGPRNIPIIGQGGIMTAHDALEFIIAGATTVGVGTALFYEPLLCKTINDGIADYLRRHKMTSVSQLVGSLQN